MVICKIIYIYVRVPVIQDASDLITTLEKLSKELRKQEQILKELRDQVNVTHLLLLIF